MSNYQIRSATVLDSDLIAKAISLSAGGYAQLGWKEKQAEYPGLSLVEIGGRLYAQDRQPFTWRNGVIAESEAAEPIGVMLAYGIDLTYKSAEPRVESDDAKQDVYYPVRLEVPDSWYICGMTVFEPWRGKGIGSKLLQLAHQQAAEHGYQQLSLIAFEQNPGSVRWYLRNGFRIVERRQIIPHPMIEYTGDALLMAVPLGG